LELQQTNSKIWYHSNEKRKAELVLDEVGKIPEDSTVYKSVGRMFMDFLIFNLLFLGFYMFTVKM
jgi:chaperonin cofactor prefoldin